MLLPTKLIPSCSLFSHWVVSDSSPPHELQHARLSCLSLSTGVCLNFCPLSWWHHPAISSSVAPFSSFPQSFPASGSFAVSQLCIIRCPKYWSFRFSIIPSNEYSWLIAFRMDWIELTAVQEALKSLLSPVPQFERINSSVLRLLYGPTLMSIHDYWKNHSFGCTDLCWQSDISAFEYTVYVCHSFSSKEQLPFNFIAIVTVCNDFGAQEKKICHCFYFPLLFAMKWWDQMPWS